MRVAVFGLGYVGSVTAACLAALGHEIVGVDTNHDKVDIINDGRSPVSEPGVDDLVADAVEAGRLRATTDPTEAVSATDMALLCVGTPSRANGDIDMVYIESVCAEIGRALAGLDKSGYLVVIRSTVVPGTSERALAVLRQHGAADLDPSVAVNPEFLREGQAVGDFMEPPLILVGADDPAITTQVLDLYEGIEAERRAEPTRLAEMVKYANNSWHAAKITFANEIGLVARSLGLDGVGVMDLLCLDEKLNISRAYLRPGFAFGGSCLPKDLRALNFMAKDNDVATPMLSSLLVSNSLQIQRVIDQLVTHQGKTLGFIGLAFKANTDDLRESPIVEVIERMLGKGFDCLIHDADVSQPDLIGGNRDYIEREIPHLDRLVVDDPSEVVTRADILIVSKHLESAAEALAARRPDQLLIDLIGLDPALREPGPYSGVAW